jgi:hypothetical protein
MKDVRKWIVVRKKGVIDDFFRINDSFFGNNIGSRHGIFHEGEHESKVGENAFALALGIAIQNFPEGAIISMPLCRLLLFPGCLCGGQGFFCC